MGGIRIEAGAQVGADAVVTPDVMASTLIVGSPERPMPWHG